MKSPVLAAEIVNLLDSIFKDKQKSIALHEPLFEGNEWKYVKECLDTGWVSSVGKYVDQFEQKLEEFTGIKRAIAVVNGTAALHISLLLAEVKTGDEVLTPTLSFVATANAITYCGAIPHFIDSCKATLGVDPTKLNDYLKEISEIKNGSAINKNTGRTIRCLVVMHTFGHPVELDSLLEICNRYHITLIEDVAESIGSYYKGKHTGHWGKLSCLSFNGNKTVTTGGGGAILANDDKLADLARHLTTTAKISHPWNFYHDQIGYNYRMPNLNAALGVAQMEKLPLFVENKRKLAKRYIEAFKEVDGIKCFKEPDYAESNYWLNALILDKPNMNLRNEIIEETTKNGFITRPVWTLMHKLPMYKDCPRMNLDTAEKLEASIINIPSSSFLKELLSVPVS